MTSAEQPPRAPSAPEPPADPAAPPPPDTAKAPPSPSEPPPQASPALDLGLAVALATALVYTAGWAYAYRWYARCDLGLNGLELPVETLLIYGFWTLREHRVLLFA
jgi:hypothetical protein